LGVLLCHPVVRRSGARESRTQRKASRSANSGASQFRRCSDGAARRACTCVSRRDGRNRTPSGGHPGPWERCRGPLRCGGATVRGLVYAHNNRDAVPTGRPLRSGRHRRLKDRLGREAVDPVIPRHMAASLPGADLGGPGTKARSGSHPAVPARQPGDRHSERSTDKDDVAPSTRPSTAAHEAAWRRYRGHGFRDRIALQRPATTTGRQKRPAAGTPP
jgi:hypothetical protein